MLNLAGIGGTFFTFFFSSRRRHTRSLYDWSSDVCSSDLAPHAPHAPHAFDVQAVVMDVPTRVCLGAAARQWRLRQQREKAAHAKAGSDRTVESRPQIGRASCRERLEISQRARQDKRTNQT